MRSTVAFLGLRAMLKVRWLKNYPREGGGGGGLLRGEAYGGPNRDMATQFLHHKVNLKKKIYLHVNSTTQRCSNKILKTSLIEDFFHLTHVLLTLVVHLKGTQD